MSKIVVYLRFGAVGITATLVFFLVSWMLIWTAVLSATTIYLIAFSISVFFSYGGHYRFTYRIQGSRHAYFSKRYLAVTAALASLSLLSTHVAVVDIGASPYGVSAAISCLYPVASFALNHFWTFVVDDQSTALISSGAPAE